MKMANNYYEFEVVLAGFGETPEKAWVNAVNSFCDDPGDWPEPSHVEATREWEKRLCEMDAGRNDD
jgi:hypothetical protein